MFPAVFLTLLGDDAQRPALPQLLLQADGSLLSEVLASARQQQQQLPLTRCLIETGK